MQIVNLFYMIKRGLIEICKQGGRIMIPTSRLKRIGRAKRHRQTNYYRIIYINSSHNWLDYVII